MGTENLVADWSRRLAHGAVAIPPDRGTGQRFRPAVTSQWGWRPLPENGLPGTQKVSQLAPLPGAGTGRDGLASAFERHVNGELEALSSGQLYRFADWPNDAVPAIAAGAYTVWDGDKLVYAGMAGRSLTADSIMEHRDDPTRVTGLRSRLASHASGRRSGDQFCVYVADRLVLPRLDQETIRAVADGTASLDSHVRQYIHDTLTYRFIETADGNQARALEDRVRRGGLAEGPPVLNPR